MKKFADMTVAEQCVFVAERAAQNVQKDMNDLRKTDDSDPDIEVIARALRQSARYLEQCVYACGRHGVRDHHERLLKIAAEADDLAGEYVIG